jgi:hypothetical protein
MDAILDRATELCRAMIGLCPHANLLRKFGEKNVLTFECADCLKRFEIDLRSSSDNRITRARDEEVGR